MEDNKANDIKKLEDERDRAWSMVYAAQRVAVKKEQELQKILESMKVKINYNPHGRD